MNLATVNLSMNISDFVLGKDAAFHGRAGHVMDCNPGGSIICDPGTGGCGTAGMSCVGSSCSNDSSFDVGMEALIRVNPADLAKLRRELQSVMSKYAASAKKSR